MFEALADLIVSSNKLDGELRAPRDPILNGDSCCAMQFDDPSYNRKPKSCTSGLAAIATPETAKNKILFLLRYARTPIPHPHRAVFLYNKLNDRSRRGVLNGVLCKIADCALHHL